MADVETTRVAGEVFREDTHEPGSFLHVIERSAFEVPRTSRLDALAPDGGNACFRVNGDALSALNFGPPRYHEVLVELEDPGR